MCDWNEIIQQQKEVTEKIIKNFDDVSKIIGDTIKPEIHFFKRLANPEIMYTHEPVYEVSRIICHGEKARAVASLIEMDLPLQSSKPLEVLYKISYLLLTAIELVNNELI